MNQPNLLDRCRPKVQLVPTAAWLLALTACATPQLPTPAPSDPIQIAAQTRATPDGPQRWTIARLDLTRLRLAITPGTGASPHEFQPQTTTAALAAAPLARLAINASFYAIPTNAPDASQVPAHSRGLDAVGLVIASGQTYSQPETSSRIVAAVLCITPIRVTIEAAPACADPAVRDAVAAGPVLLRDGVAPSPALQSEFATRRHPRSAIALSADARTGWLVVVDGRQAGSIGATLPELTAVLAELGADDALNLDGGGSTALALRTGDGAARLLNTPIDRGIPGQERAVATHILVIPAPPAG